MSCTVYPAGTLFVTFNTVTDYATQISTGIVICGILYSTAVYITMIRYPFPLISLNTIVLFGMLMTGTSLLTGSLNRMLPRDQCETKIMTSRLTIFGFGLIGVYCYYIALLYKTLAMNNKASKYYKYGAYLLTALYFAMELYFRIPAVIVCNTSLSGYSISYQSTARAARSITLICLNFYLLSPFLYNLLTIVTVMGNNGSSNVTEVSISLLTISHLRI
jgi:hypothetical protein